MVNEECGIERRGRKWRMVIGICGMFRQCSIENNGLQSGPSISVENKPTIRVEKPYITLKTSGAIREEHYQFELRVPSVTYGNDAIGPQFVDTHEEVRNFKRVYLAVPSNSTNKVLRIYAG